MDSIEKNLLDLQHSLYSTKASLFFSIGVGGAIAIFFGIREMSIKMINVLIPLIWLIPFVWLAINYFVRCSGIQKEIENFIKLGKKTKNLKIK